jgi:hypothetical protein
MFSSEVLVRGGRSRREAPRSLTAFDTSLRSSSGASRSPCRIIDISSSGARLRLYQDLDPETSIQLVLPVKGPVDAHVVWANGHEAGCRFDRPLDEATVAKLQITATERGGG